jgi:hypothetical protein
VTVNQFTMTTNGHWPDHRKIGDACAMKRSRSLAAWSCYCGGFWDDSLSFQVSELIRSIGGITLTAVLRRSVMQPGLMQDTWIAEYRARWAAQRAAASVAAGDGGAWLDGEAARVSACDATLVPVVIGDVDAGAVEEVIARCR